MGKYVPVTTNQTDAVCQMANEKKVGRARFQEAMNDGDLSRFLDSLLEQSQSETKKSSVPAHLYEFQFEKDGADAPTLVARTRGKFFVSKDAEAMTENATEFVVGPKEKVIVRVFTCESLDVTGWAETDFFDPNGFAHIKKFGLLPCISDDAFGIRATHSEQKLDEWIWVAHPPISARGYRRMFHVGLHSYFGRSVYGYGLRSSCQLPAGLLVALRVA